MNNNSLQFTEMDGSPTQIINLRGGVAHFTKLVNEFLENNGYPIELRYVVYEETEELYPAPYAFFVRSDAT